jgi:hypothetical protein
LTFEQRLDEKEVEDSMALSPEYVDTAFDWDHISETHEIVYMVKRPTYELLFAVPRRRACYLGEDRPIFQVRFKYQCQIPGLIFDIEDIEDFYDGLSRLMEYVQMEQDRHREQF